MSTSHPTLFAAFAAFSCVLATSDAAAQGFAPAEGSVWMKLGYIYSDADNNYAGLDEVLFDPEATRGEEVPFRARTGQVVGGELLSHEATLDAVWAPRDRAVLGVFAPLFKHSFYSNTVNDYTTKANGVGDIQLYGGWQLTPRDQWKVGSTLYVRGKIPTSFKYPYTNQAILGEGQFDLSAALANTFAIMPRLHMNATVELRQRFGWVRNDVSQCDAAAQGPYAEGCFADPGEELHVTTGVGGGPTDWLWLSANYTGMWGTPWRIRHRGYEETQARVQREFHTVSFGAYFMFGEFFGVDGLALDTFARLPFAGQDHAVMRSFGGGLAYQF